MLMSPLVCMQSDSCNSRSRWFVSWGKWLPALLLLISGALEIRWSVGAEKGCMPPRLGRVRGPRGFGRVEEVELFALLPG